MILYHNADLISIHALREEGDKRPAPCGLLTHLISIHALREEGDPAAAINPFALC